MKLDPPTTIYGLVSEFPSVSSPRIFSNVKSFQALAFIPADNYITITLIKVICEI